MTMTIHTQRQTTNQKSKTTDKNEPRVLALPKIEILLLSTHSLAVIRLGNFLIIKYTETFSGEHKKEMCRDVVVAPQFSVFIHKSYARTPTLSHIKVNTITTLHEMAE